MSASMSTKKRRIAFSSNRELNRICALVLPKSSKIMSIQDSFHKQNTLFDIASLKSNKEISIESEERLNQTLMGAKNTSPFSDGMFNTIQNQYNSPTNGNGVWKELFNFVQGRCKSFGVHNFIITKKCKDDIIQLIKSFKASTDLILHDYEVFQRYIFEKKINPLLENKEISPNENELCQTYIKLAYDRDFFSQLKEQFPSKLVPKSDSKQWKAQIINEEHTPINRDKNKSKKKAQIREIKQMKKILNFQPAPHPPKKVRSGFKIDIINEQEKNQRKVFSTSPKSRSKNRLSTAIKDFMLSETFKLLMAKQREKSKDDEDSESRQDTKEDTTTPKQKNKRGAIFFRKSALQKENEESNANTTPTPIITKDHKLGVINQNNFISFTDKWNHNGRMKSTCITEKLKIEDSNSSTSNKHIEFINMKRESIKVSFFRHRAPKKSLFNKLSMIDKTKLVNLTSLKSQLKSSARHPKRNHSTCKNLNMCLSADDNTVNDRKRSALSPQCNLRFNKPLIKIDNDFNSKLFMTNDLETIAEKGPKSPLLKPEKNISNDKKKSSMRPRRHVSTNQQIVGNF